MLQTPLNDWHHQHHGRLVDFAGWQMPIQYSTIVAEHNCVRTAVGLFDIAHMGRLHFRGADAANFLNTVSTIDVTQLQSGRIRYALAMNEQGGVADDILIYRLPDEFLLVVNASNRIKLLELWSDQIKQYADLSIDDRTQSTAMIAFQGPLAADLLDSIFPGCSALRYYRCESFAHDGVDYLISRTGYTGEDGFEIIGPNQPVVALWSELMQLATENGGQACGLGCRDTLRLEAGMPLYGHELNDDVSPYEAGLQFAVMIDKSDFWGKSVIQTQLQAGLTKRRVGLEYPGKRVAREHAAVLDQDENLIGEITSGTFSPTLQKPIGMAYVNAAHSELGATVLVDIRGQHVPATVVELPFYRRKR